MDITVNRHSQLPIHTQLKARLTHLIEAGQLLPGMQLPTMRQRLAQLSAGIENQRVRRARG
jgi:DNA-binding transcriptional regulator YhcF (GntR family)